MRRVGKYLGLSALLLRDVPLREDDDDDQCDKNPALDFSHALSPCERAAPSQRRRRRAIIPATSTTVQSRSLPRGPQSLCYQRFCEAQRASEDRGSPHVRGSVVGILRILPASASASATNQSPRPPRRAGAVAVRNQPASEHPRTCVRGLKTSNQSQAALRLALLSAISVSSRSVRFSSASVSSRSRTASFMPSCEAQELRVP